MSSEDRARIARENGARSKGPVTPEGKARSSQNARKDPDPLRDAKLACLTPAHPAALCHEDRALFDHLTAVLVGVYQPRHHVALSIVHAIAAAQWQIERLQRCLTMHWNLALLDASRTPPTLAPELHSLQFDVRASAAMLLGDRLVSRCNTEIARLHQSIARLERRLRFVHANFPATPPADENRTQPPTENTELTPAAPPISAENEPVFVTEDIPAVLQAYRHEFPHRPIVVLQPDNVAKGIPEPDHLPLAPRKAS